MCTLPQCIYCVFGFVECLLWLSFAWLACSTTVHSWVTFFFQSVPKMSTEPSTSDSKQSDPVTPESNEVQEPSLGGWFSSIVQSAKDTVSKSAGTLESIKRDLSEFKDAVQNDATSMVYSTASMVKTKLNEIGNTVNEIGSLGTDEIETNEVNQGDINDDQIEQNPSTSEEATAEQSELPFNLETINSWTNILTDKAKTTINMMKETLVDSIFINREFLIDELAEEPYVLKDGQIVPIKNWKELLHNLQINSDTYCREPSGSPEEFELWLTKFNLINYQKQMEYLLETVAEIRKLHQDLVPKELSDSDFWHRYYYKVHQLKEEQKRIILNSDDCIAADETINESNSVNIKYLSEKSSESRGDSESKVSRSSTEDWEKMTDGSNVVSKETDKSSSDEDRDEWVKCD